MNAGPAPAARVGALARLLDPETICIVGATPNLHRIGGIPLGSLLAHGFPKDRILLVNPKYDRIEGIDCHPSCADLPWAPDMAVIAVRAEEVVPALEALYAKGTRAAVVFAAGFGEEKTASGRRLDAELRAFLARTGMKIAGPNTIGTANVRDRTNGSFMSTFNEDLPAGPFAFVGQSGNTISMMIVAGRDQGLGASYFVSTGNEIGVEFSEYLEHFLQDPGTGAVLGYAEELRDGPRFVRAAQALRAAGKPLFLMKAGTSEKAREATMSHTGAMAGDTRVYRAAFRQLGVGLGRDPNEVLDMALLWRLGREVTSRRIALVSLSGAGCAFLSDLYAEHGAEIPTLPEDVQARLRKVVPDYGMVSNPVDLTGNVMNDLEHLRAVLEALCDSDAVDTVVIYLMGILLDLASDIIREVQAKTGKLIVAIDPLPLRRNEELREAGIFVFNDLMRGVTSLSAFLDWSEASAAPTWSPERAAPALPEAEEILRAAREARGEALDEAEAKRLLAVAGIAVVEEARAGDADAAAEAACRLGYPVAVKVLSPDIAHKTESGGVALDLRDEDAVRSAFGAVTGRAARAVPGARIEGALVQRQVTDGVPILLGVTRDSTFGPVMTVGLGGVTTELYADVATRLLPVTEDVARAMIEDLSAKALLRGFRGAPTADEAALVQAMVRLSDLALALGDDWAEIEANPLLVRPEGLGVVAVDGLVALRRPANESGQGG